MKKNHAPHITRAAVQAKAPFPEERHVLTERQREIPNPALAIADAAMPMSEAILEREKARRDAVMADVSAPTVREDLHAVRRRPLDAPMATRIGEFQDPLATMAWDAIVADAAEKAGKWWGKWQFTAALAVWSVACFLLGTMV